MKFEIISSTFNFECTMCGNCCTGDQKVNLNLYDLYKMAHYCGFQNSNQLFEKKIVHLIKARNDSWIPQIKFKCLKRSIKRNAFFKQDIIFCPFLINELDEQNNLKGLCSLHPGKKPLVCAMAPVGRILDLKKQTEEFVFVKPAPDCTGVESQEVNVPVETKNDLAVELNYEKRFFIIMDSLLKKNHYKSFYINHIFSFNTDIPFEEIIGKLEVELSDN